MRPYLAEGYAPRVREASAARRRLKVVAEQIRDEGAAVRYIRTTFLPDDEMCFHVFEANSVEVVRELCIRAGLSAARIAVAVEVQDI